MKQSLYILLLTFGSFASAQQKSPAHFGGKVGLIYTFGTHTSSIGISLHAYYQQYFYQGNVSSTWTYQLRNLGKRQFYWENRNAIGLLLLGGKRRTFQDFQLGELYHQSHYHNGIGYSYIWYLDSKKTSQRSGALAIHTKNLSILFENDLFAGQGKDRFRTGALEIYHLEEGIKYQIGLKLWTGETKGLHWEKEDRKNTPYGYADLSKLPYGKTSHGILYTGIHFELPYLQTGHLHMGIDGEQIRHIIQNRLTHDLIGLPKKMVRKTPNYPRLNTDGLPVFSKSEIRKNELYILMGLNANWSY